MDPEEKKKEKDKVLEIIDKYDKKNKIQLELSNENAELKDKIRILSNEVFNLEKELKRKDLIIEKKDEIIDRNSRKITELTNSIFALERENQALQKREAALLVDLQSFMKDVGDKTDINKLQKEKLKVLTTEGKVEEKESIFKIKLVMLGEYAVGKTALIQKFAKNQFNPRYSPTIGAEITKMRLRYKNDVVELTIWDVAGQIAFKNMADKFIQGANAVLYMFDTTRVDTLNLIKEWSQQAKKVLKKKVPSILICNKIDLNEERKVSRELAIKIAQEIESELIETSVKDNKNIKEALILVISKYMETQ